MPARAGQTRGILHVRSRETGESYSQEPLLRHATSIRTETQGGWLTVVPMRIYRVSPTSARKGSFSASDLGAEKCQASGGQAWMSPLWPGQDYRGPRKG